MSHPIQNSARHQNIFIRKVTFLASVMESLNVRLCWWKSSLSIVIVCVMKMCTKGERNEREETEKHWGKLFLVDMETERKEEIYVRQEKPVNMPSEELTRETNEY